MLDLSVESIDKLRSKWNSLSDLDRAKEIDTIRRSKVSTRRIARGLHHSDSLLRHLLDCLEASPEDQGLARCNRISTSELSRRGHAAKVRRLAPSPEVVEARRKELVREGADIICNWIVNEGHNRHHGKLIIEGAIREIEVREWNRRLPAIPKHAPIPVEVFIQRGKPKTNRPRTGTVAHDNWYVQWLAQWAYSAFEDSMTRENALRLSLVQQNGR